ncbi:hypothetical protein AB0A77_27340 [Streptomyces varsoviensis]|uniref:hypothetical protein n=1 Tax=Streptomyces varsoviensis TaxID=67373 RepID=UPI0033D478A3
MPQAPAFVGDLATSLLGRRTDVLDVREPAPGFLELELRAEAPSGGWQPGHEVQFRITPSLTRRYTVRTVGGPDSEHISILAATEAAGPGTAWLRSLRVGDRITALAARYWPLREHGTRRLYLGDGCSLGTLDAYAQRGAASVGAVTVAVAVEVPAPAVAPLAERWPEYRFLPAGDSPGDALQSWLERALHEGEFKGSGLDGALLLGHAQSIQRQRRTLTDSQALSRRAITTKPYWSTGKTGL